MNADHLQFIQDLGEVFYPVDAGHLNGYIHVDSSVAAWTGAPLVIATQEKLCRILVLRPHVTVDRSNGRRHVALDIEGGGFSL